MDSFLSMVLLFFRPVLSPEPAAGNGTGNCPLKTGAGRKRWNGIIRRCAAPMKDNAQAVSRPATIISKPFITVLPGERTKEALRYCEDLRTPIREVSQTVWTGDKAAGLPDQQQKWALGRTKSRLKTAVHIEYPRNTNIRSAGPDHHFGEQHAI